MICPVCRIEMIAVERHAIELDHCINCRGLWFDHEELDLLAELTGISTSGLDSLPSRPGRGRRPCPRCNATLDEMSVETVQLDRCPRAHGFWFDHGELGRFVRSAESDASLVPISTFLGEVFERTQQQKE